MNNRFYVNASFDESTKIEGTEFHHLVHVMRIQAGDEIEIVNGRGNLACARVEKMDKRSAHLTILHREISPKPEPSIRIGLAFIRMERLEWAIEKGTELGADAFTLFPAEHSEKKQLSVHQFDRLIHIAIAAIKQCGRLYLPEINIAPSLNDLLQSDALILFGDTAPEILPLSLIPYCSSVLFISGPEKGFSEDELGLLQQHAQGVSLSKNILRAETAPIAALSILSQKQP
jgi:16S rRNA (uracil1498-N3)-methyltransferase